MREEKGELGTVVGDGEGVGFLGHIKLGTGDGYPPEATVGGYPSLGLPRVNLPNPTHELADGFTAPVSITEIGTQNRNLY